MSTIVYAHGFKSSSQSRKATQLREHLAAHHTSIEWIAPDLSFDPATALDQLDRHCRAHDAQSITVIGSSLGGFYAHVLAERHGCRAVLLNPSIRPYETLAKYLGPQENLYTHERFTFDASHIDTLRALAPAAVTRPQRYLVVVEMGDELLDHHRTLAHFAGAAHIVVEGGDHELKSFPRHIPAVLRFAGIAQ